MIREIYSTQSIECRSAHEQAVGGVNSNHNEVDGDGTIAGMMPNSHRQSDHPFRVYYVSPEPNQGDPHWGELLSNQLQFLKGSEIHNIHRTPWVDVHFLDYVIVDEHLNYQSFMADRGSGDGIAEAVKYHLG